MKGLVLSVPIQLRYEGASFIISPRCNEDICYIEVPAINTVCDFILIAFQHMNER